MQPIVTLTLPLHEAQEFYRAMIARFLMEEALRREQGLEPIQISPFVRRLEQVLGIQTDQALAHLDQVEDELWQHTWLSFTDEWAWHRAQQEVKKGVSAEELALLSSDEIERATEKCYEEKFDQYTKEIQLPGHEDGQLCAEGKGESASSGRKAGRVR